MLTLTELRAKYQKLLEELGMTDLNNTDDSIEIAKFTKDLLLSATKELSERDDFSSANLQESVENSNISQMVSMQEPKSSNKKSSLSLAKGKRNSNDEFEGDELKEIKSPETKALVTEQKTKTNADIVNIVSQILQFKVLLKALKKRGWGYPTIVEGLKNAFKKIPGKSDDNIEKLMTAFDAEIKKAKSRADNDRDQLVKDIIDGIANRDVSKLQGVLEELQKRHQSKSNPQTAFTANIVPPHKQDTPPPNVIVTSQPSQNAIPPSSDLTNKNQDELNQLKRDLTSLTIRHFNHYLEPIVDIMGTVIAAGGEASEEAKILNETINITGSIEKTVILLKYMNDIKELNKLIEDHNLEGFFDAYGLWLLTSKMLEHMPNDMPVPQALIQKAKSTFAKTETEGTAFLKQLEITKKNVKKKLLPLIEELVSEKDEKDKDEIFLQTYSRWLVLEGMPSDALIIKAISIFVSKDVSDYINIIKELNNAIDTGDPKTFLDTFNFWWLTHTTPVPAILMLTAIKIFGGLTPESQALIRRLIDTNIPFPRQMAENIFQAIMQDPNRANFFDHMIATTLDKNINLLTDNCLIAALEYAIENANQDRVADLYKILAERKLSSRAALQKVSEKTLITGIKHPNSVAIQSTIQDILKTDSELSPATLAAAIETGNIQYINDICAALKRRKIPVPEDFIPLIIEKLIPPFLKEAELERFSDHSWSSQTDAKRTAILDAYNAVIKTIPEGKISVITFIKVINNKLIDKKFVQPIIDAVGINLSEKFLQTAIETGNREYIRAVCVALKKAASKEHQIKLPESLIQQSLQIPEVFKEIKETVVATGGEITEATLLEGMKQGYGIWWHKEFLQLILPAIAEGKLTLASLSQAIENGNTQYIVAICAELKRRQIPVPQYFIPLVIEKLIPPFLKNAKLEHFSHLSWEAGVKQDRETILRAFNAVMEAVPKDRISETTLITVMQNKLIDIPLVQPIISALGAELSGKSLQTAIEQDNCEYINAICEELKKAAANGRRIKLSEDLVAAALIQLSNTHKQWQQSSRTVVNNMNRLNSRSIKAISQAIVATGGEISERSLSLVMDPQRADDKYTRKSCLKDLLEAIPKDKLSIKPLRAAIAADHEDKNEFIIIICAELKKRNISIEEEILKLAATHKPALKVEAILAVMELVKKVSEETVFAVREHPEKTKLIGPTIAANIETKGKLTNAALKPVILMYKENRKELGKVILSICAELKNCNMPVLENSLESMLEVSAYYYGSELSDIPIISAMLTTITDTQQKVSEKALIALLKNRYKEIRVALMQDIIKVILADEVSYRSLSAKPLEQAIEQGNPEDTIAVCTALNAAIQKGHKVSVPEKLITLAIEKFEPIFKKSLSFAGSLSMLKEIEKERETSLKAFKAVVTIVASSKETAALGPILIDSIKKGVAPEFVESIVEVMKKLPAEALDVAIATKSEKYVSILCKDPSKYEKPLSENLVIKTVEQGKKERALEVLKTVKASGGKFSENPLVAVMDQFKYKHSDASELVGPMIDAILQNPSNKEALQKSDNKFLNKAFQMAMVHENPKYFSQLCLVLQENNFPISQEIIRFAIEIYCSKESSSNTRELIETRLQLIFTKIEKLDLEKRLVAILGERESRNRNPKFLQPIIAVTADLSNAALMAALKAQEFFKTDKADIVFSLCAVLQVKQPVPPVPEDTLILAINELVPTMNNNYYYDGEAEKLAREMVCAVLNTVIASGNPVSGKTLLAMAAKQPQNSMFAQPIIDGIKKKNGDLPIETLESIFALKAARAYAGGISKLLLERKIQIPEKFIILANDQRSGNELILQMLHDVVASGAKVSELTLQAVLNNSNNKDLISPVIDAIIKTNTKTNTPLSFETLSKLLTTMKLSSSAQLSFHETSRVSAKELNNLKIKLFEAYLKSGNSLTTEAQSLAKLHGITDEVQKIANNDIIRVADKKDVLEV